MTDEQRFKYNFKIFFEGIKDVYDVQYGGNSDEWLVKPVISIPVYRFGITDIGIEFKSEEIVCTLTLLFTGFFIGVRGSNLISIENHLSELYEKSVKFKIIESKLWS